MKDRPLALQEKMASTMTQKNMTMGVFVDNYIYWTEPNLTSGENGLGEEF